MRSVSSLAVLLLFAVALEPVSAELQVGAALTDVSPLDFPVLVNGGMTTRSATSVRTPVIARSIVVDDGAERIAIVVVDSCMMPRALLDQAKQLASRRTRIKADRMLISATHTHTAPSCMGALGTAADLKYVPYLREKLAESIAAAEQHLEPAEVGYASGDANQFTALRRWIRRPDRIAEDPFGNKTVRANMHSARNWDDVTGPSGPEDPELSLIAFRSLTGGRPIAALANFSMHYFGGEQQISADYFGQFCNGLEARVAGTKHGDHPPFVAVMSHGCSGDIWRRDYAIAESDRPNPSIEEYTQGLLEVAATAHQSIQYESSATIAMAEARLPMKYRVPDRQRLEWAQRVVKAMGDRPPKDRVEVYAREQLILHDLQATEVVVQAVRIGNIGIATTPNETYALTGLKVKLQSPLANTMVIELANGGDGYIPPPEQHFLGGYNTWAARSAGLEVQAEPKIVEADLRLLEEVAGQPRRAFKQTTGPITQATLNANPSAFYRLDEFGGPRAHDASPHQRDAIFDPGVAFFLEGPPSARVVAAGDVNRAVHFAGGRLRTQISDLGDSYSVSLWFWNGMPNDARRTTGWLFSRGRDNSLGLEGDHVGIGGSGTQPGKLVFAGGGTGHETRVGKSAIERWTWNHLLFIRDGEQVRIHLNGKKTPEIDITSPPTLPPGNGQIFFGGRADNDSNFEGRLDEIAIFARVLAPGELSP